MSGVQEIEQALAQLSREELVAVEKWIAEHLTPEDQAVSYAQQEYGVSRDELDRFDERMREHNTQTLIDGQTTLFEGSFDPACLD